MEYRKIELDRIDQEAPDAEMYVFTYRPDLSELASSIDRAGLLVAPVLQEDQAGVCRVVSGSSRIKVLRSLGWKSVDAFVSSHGEMTDAECLSRSILENRWHRGFNEVEKALLFTRLQDRFPHLVPGLTQALGRDLNMPQDEKALEPYRFLLSLSEPILQGVARGELALAQALLLRRLPQGVHLAFFRIMTECGLTSQESRKAVQWVQETAGREEREVADILQEEAIQKVLNENTDPRRKARLLFSVLSKLRHPLLEFWKDRFASVRSQLSTQDKNIRVSHDPTFETTQIKVQIQAASESELRERLATLSEAAREGKIEELFQTLAVAEQDPLQKNGSP
jgi:ParB-like chromosome segregation protein Spo0J